MSATNPMAAEILEASAAGFASAAQARLQTQRGFAGAEDAAAWRAHFEQRVLELAAAVRVGEPELFARRIVWLRRAAAARGAGESAIALALASLESALAEELPEALRGSVSPAIRLAREALERPLDVESEGLDAKDPAGRLALEYIATCLEGDPDRAMDLILAALDDGLPTRDVYCRVLIPAQREVGQLWHAGDISIAEEHLVTETTRRIMSRIAARGAPARPVGRTLLAASVAGNAHDLGLRAAADLFALAGWRCLFLGANVPPADLADAVEVYGVDLVMLTATLSTQLAAMTATVDEIRRRSRAVKILIGGIAFDEAPELWKRVGADAFSARIEEVVDLGEGLVSRADG